MIHHKKSKTVFEEDVFQYLFPTAGSQQFLTQVQLRLRLFGSNIGFIMSIIVTQKERLIIKPNFNMISESII